MSGSLADTNFDALADRFGERIYGSVKGRLRLELVWRDLAAHVPQLNSATALQCADIGGGQGQFSELLLGQGHSVLLNDVSGKMLAAAAGRLGDPDHLKIDHGSLQALCAATANKGAFDFVACHAVLEWLADPLACLPGLLGLLKPGGVLSLMFYNRNGMILNDMVKGNYQKLMAEEFAGEPGGLTPPNPMSPQVVVSAVTALDATVVSRRGIRCAWDVLRRERREQRSFEDVLEVEWKYGDREPFWQLGRYVHLLIRR